MLYPKIPLAQTVLELCKSKKIQQIVISPGSRNAPLTIGFSNHTYFKCYSIVDERCAAFFALGIAQQLQEPVALLCTSGSALLNYYPAIAEAFYSDIPLIILSTDRPPHLIDVGDGQTINQKNVFANHILYAANLKINSKEEKNIETYNDFEINTAINTALLQNGPVHINIPFDEPLYQMVEKLSVKPEIIEISTEIIQIDSNVIKKCFETWNSASKKMILVGVNKPNALEEKWIEAISKDESVIVLTETTSNLHHDSFFPNIDQLIVPLSEEEQLHLQPEILVTFGGFIVSKKIKAFLRKFQPKQHWHINNKKAFNTFFCLSLHLKTTPNLFFEALLPRIIPSQKSDYKPYWTSIKNKRLAKHELYLNTIPFSDFKAFDLVLKSIPNNSILQIGNSSAIRYAQLFDSNKHIDVFCNRGTSGIDGSTSAAIGCAVISKKPTVFISGDLSFFYDSNALWNNYIPKNFRIIIINNQGGGIFRILPGKKNTENFDTFFETKHNLKAKHLCDMYGFEYVSGNSELQIKDELQHFYSASETPKLLEIFTPRLINDEILLKYFEFVS